MGAWRVFHSQPDASLFEDKQKKRKSASNLHNDLGQKEKEHEVRYIKNTNLNKI